MRKSALLAFGLVVAIIVALGLVILSSASEANGVRLHHDPYFFMKRQFVFLGAGLVVATAAALFDYHRWRDSAWLTWTAFGVVLVMLILVFPPFGKPLNGSYRWIDCGPFNIQPSEFAKLMVVIALSVWLDRLNWRVESFGRGASVAALLIALLAGPVILETDLGSTMVIGLAGALIMFVAGVRILHLLAYGAIGAVLFIVRLAMNGNRMARLMAFTHIRTLPGAAGSEVMDAAARDAEYQAKHALVAISNGGLFGVGLNQSMEKHYYLPESHTDFIFAIGAEELGLVFSLGTFILFVIFFALSVYIAANARDRFGKFLVIGMAFIVFFQAMFNIGVVCDALPTKGMALPFFSYGGTNMITSFFAVGTILSVGIHSYRERKRKAFHG